MYKLYGGKFTRAIIVQMVMAEGDIDYEHIEIDIIKDEHRKADFLALNPAGYVPVLITPDGKTITETPAINLYLCEKHSLSELAPGIEEDDRGFFLSSLFFLSDDLEPALKQVFYPHLYVLREEDIAAMKQKSLNLAMNRLGMIEKRLQANGPYHLGERFSLVDIILSFWLEYLNCGGQLDDYPALSNCLKLVAKRPVLRPYFEQLTAWQEEYARLQAAGAGFK